MRWVMVVVAVLALTVGSVVAAEPPPPEVTSSEEVASSTRVVRGRAALDASLAEGWRVASERATPEGVVYELAWGGD
jgi:hypothetical protein